MRMQQIIEYSQLFAMFKICIFEKSKAYKQVRQQTGQKSL